MLPAHAEFPSWISLFFALLMQKPCCIHTVVTYALFLSYIIAFFTSVGGVLMLYNCVLILYFPKTLLRFVTKSLLSLVASECQRHLARGQHSARLFQKMQELTSMNEFPGPWRAFSASSFCRYFTHMKFLSLKTFEAGCGVLYRVCLGGRCQV